MVIGNTVRITGTFATWAGSLADVTSPTLAIYEGRTLKETISLDESAHVATGTYQYDYVIPSGLAPLVFELSGLIEGLPEVARIEVGRKWV